MGRDFSKIGQTIVLSTGGSNKDIRKGIHQVIPAAVKQIKPKAKAFKGSSELDTCYRIWRFLKSNIQYQEDSIHFQDLRLPLRLMKDGKGDCKSYSIFTVAVLKNLGIPCKLVYTSYNPKNQTPSHVYVQTNSGIIIDGVWTNFNSEKPFAYKHLANV